MNRKGNKQTNKQTNSVSIGMKNVLRFQKLQHVFEDEGEDEPAPKGGG